MRRGMLVTCSARLCCCAPALPSPLLAPPAAPSLPGQPRHCGREQALGRVCWSSRQLWRRLDFSSYQPGPPIACPAAASPQLSVVGAGQGGNNTWQLRTAAWRAANRSLLEQVGHLAEAVALSSLGMGRSPSPAGLLSRLSPSTLSELAQRWRT